MFSVIIPLYNKELYVEKAIQSVLTQTNKNFELMVIDDGSSDNSLQIVRGIDFSGYDVKIIEQKNQGVSITRNNGVKLAKYEFIAFLDADDWWEPTFLEEMKKLIEKFPCTGIYGSGYYIVRDEKKRNAPIGVDPDFKEGYINYCRVYIKTLCMPLWTGSVIIPKKVFDEEKGFKPQLKLGEDFDLWVRTALKYPVIFLNKPLANYNQDVDISNRAVGGKLYKAHEHMLFTDYGDLMEDRDFKYLLERLSLYSLLPYYLSKRNEKEVNSILNTINFKNHEIKYTIYYKIAPRSFLKIWFTLLRIGVVIKRKLIL